MDARFAREPPRRKRKGQLRGVGDGKRDFGYGGSIRVVQREDACGTVALDRATVVRVHEATDQGGGEKSEEGAKSEKSKGRSAKRSPMRRGTHR